MKSSWLTLTSKPELIKIALPLKTRASRRSLMFQIPGIGDLRMVSHQLRTKEAVDLAGPSLQLELLRLICLSTSESSHLSPSSSLSTALETSITTVATEVFHPMLSSMLSSLAVLVPKMPTHTTPRIDPALLTHLPSLCLLEMAHSTLQREMKMNSNLPSTLKVQYLLPSRS